MHAYDEMYLADAQNVLGDLLDYVVYDLRMNMEHFWKIFLKSDISEKMARGVVHYLVGLSGAELADRILENASETTDMVLPDQRFDKSAEYWTGWALSYYQWYTGVSFQRINEQLPLEKIYLMYDKYHEMDILCFVEEADRIRKMGHLESYLKQLRKKQGLKQSELARLAGLSVRTLQQYEQRQKNINHASAEVVISLARVLGSRPEELLEN